MATSATQTGGSSKNVRASCHHKPYLYSTTQLKYKKKKPSLSKVWRDWESIMNQLCDYRIFELGYEIPSQLTDCSLVRIAVDEDDLDLLLGRTPHWMLYRCLRDLWNSNWLTVLCMIPWLLYNIMVRDVRSIIVQLIFYGNTDPLIEHHLAFWWTLAIFVVGSLCNRYFGWKQSWIVIKVGAQAFQMAQMDNWNAEQEKTSETTTASMPVQTKSTNEGFSASRNLHGVMSVQYTATIKLLCAAQAMGVCVLHDTRFVKTPGKKKAENVKPSGVSISTPNETDDVTSMTYIMIPDRTSTALPNVLRPGVEVKPKTNEQLRIEIEKGKQRTIDGEKPPNNFSSVAFGPRIISIIAGLAKSKINEISGLMRHLRLLKYQGSEEYLPPCTPEVEARLDLTSRIMGKIFAEQAEIHVRDISWWKPPAKWSETMKDEMPEKAEQLAQGLPGPDDDDLSNPQGWLTSKVSFPRLQGFTKTGELQLPEKKHSRLIGDMGTVYNMSAAMSIGPLENLMKEAFPHLITKKLTLAECDEKISEILLDMRKKGLAPESDDYSAMDSSWTLNDRERLRSMAAMALVPVQAYLRRRLANYDMVRHIDAHINEKDGGPKLIMWQLHYINVLITPSDSILFSGERQTSLMNRWLVMMLEFAEDIRILGEVEGEKAIRQTMVAETKTKMTLKGITKTTTCRRWMTIGDGDDNLQGIIPGRYEDKNERIKRFADMGKLLDVCSGPNEKTDAEVLSRYHIWDNKHKDYIHVAKIERNMARLVAFKIGRTNQEDGVFTTSLTQTELRMICTDLWQRILSLGSTLVVRQFARAVFVYCYKKINKWDAGTVYDEDMKRLNRVDGDYTLSECLKQINEVLAAAPVSTWAMVKVTHFKDIGVLTKAQIKKLKKEWAAADRTWKEAEIDEKHIFYPHTFCEDYPISSNISRALGLTHECVNVALFREALEQPQDVDTDQEALDVQPRGELADVSDLSHTGRAENTSADPAREPEVFDISDPDSSDDGTGQGSGNIDPTGAGVSRGATSSAGHSKPNLSNVQDRLRSGFNYLSGVRLALRDAVGVVAGQHTESSFHDLERGDLRVPLVEMTDFGTQREAAEGQRHRTMPVLQPEQGGQLDGWELASSIEGTEDSTRRPDPAPTIDLEFDATEEDFPPEDRGLHYVLTAEGVLMLKMQNLWRICAFPEEGDLIPQCLRRNTIQPVTWPGIWRELAREKDWEELLRIGYIRYEDPSDPVEHTEETQVAAIPTAAAPEMLPENVVHAAVPTAAAPEMLPENVVHEIMEYATPEPEDWRDYANLQYGNFHQDHPSAWGTDTWHDDVLLEDDDVFAWYMQQPGSSREHTPERWCGLTDEELASRMYALEQELAAPEAVMNQILEFCPYRTGTARIIEVQGNLFSAGHDYSLCHCVSRDMAMLEGIAAKFWSLYRNVDLLRAQHAEVGQVASLSTGDHPRGNSSIYYLVTKPVYWTKPKIEDVEASLRAMRNQMQLRGENKLAMPYIGCGRDKLNWKDVRRVIQRVFEHDDIDICIYTPRKKGEDRFSRWTYSTDYPYWNYQAARRTLPSWIPPAPTRQPPGLSEDVENEINGNVGEQIPSVTSRNLDHLGEGGGDPQAVVLGVGRSMARTKCRGTQVYYDMQEGNSRGDICCEGRSPAEAEVSWAPQFPTAHATVWSNSASGSNEWIRQPVGRQADRGGSPNTHSVIKGMGRETQGAKNADTRNHFSGWTEQEHSHPGGNASSSWEVPRNKESQRGKGRTRRGKGNKTKPPVTAAAPQQNWRPSNKGTAKTRSQSDPATGWTGKSTFHAWK